MAETTTVFVTDFETVELSVKATQAIDSLKGKFYDRRTRKGKAVDSLSSKINSISRECYMLGLTTDELFKNHG